MHARTPPSALILDDFAELSVYGVTGFVAVPRSARHGSLETFGGPQRHAIAHLKAGKMVIPNMSFVMLGKSVLF